MSSNPIPPPPPGSSIITKILIFIGLVLGVIAAAIVSLNKPDITEYVAIASTIFISVGMIYHVYFDHKSTQS